MVGSFQTHDLVRVDPGIAQRWPDAQRWVAQSLARAPWVVVRRERSGEAVPIGVRGTSRSERFGTWITAADVSERISPFDLGQGSIANDRLATVYDRLRQLARAAELRVATIGSYGFELVSGVCVTHEASDLDVLVQAAGVSRTALRAFASEIDALSDRSAVRIDVELAYPDGGAALREVLAATPTVLFKTSTGPKLLPCPV